MMQLRRRRVGVKNIKELDAFPKVPEAYVETTPSGGTVSIIAFCLIIWLVVLEFSYFWDPHFKFHFVPDTDFDAKLKINVDITVAMPCDTIGADILDTTNQNVMSFGKLKEEDTWFELSYLQRAHFDSMRQVNSYLREEFHALKDLLWKSGYMSLYAAMPKREIYPDRPTDACRIHGNLVLNKVAGNFHVTAGKTLPIPRAHVHVSAFMSDQDFNFSHRIERFSFGDSSPGIIHPLEGDERIASENYMLYQYFIQVVPTDVDTKLTRVQTYQYSVRDYERPVDHDKGSHGVPGIYFKYDMSALKVQVTDGGESFWQFIIRLCATVGGIYVTTGILNRVCEFVVNLLLCRTFRYGNQEPVGVNIPVKTLLHPEESMWTSEASNSNCSENDSDSLSRSFASLTQPCSASDDLR